MAKYLDSTGVSTLWGRIKELITRMWVQSDWNVSDSSNKAYIKNKPTIPSISGLAQDTDVVHKGSSTSVPADEIIYGDKDFRGEISVSGGINMGQSSISSNSQEFDFIETANGDTLQEFLDAKVSTSSVGAANGVASLDSNGLVPSSQLPSYVDDVIEAYARTGQTALSSTWLSETSASGSALTPASGKIYVLMADAGDYSANSQFRWGGTAYVKLNDGGVSALTTSEVETICEYPT